MPTRKKPPTQKPEDAVGDEVKAFSCISDRGFACAIHLDLKSGQTHWPSNTVDQPALLTSFVMAFERPEIHIVSVTRRDTNGVGLRFATRSPVAIPGSVPPMSERVVVDRYIFNYFSAANSNMHVGSPAGWHQVSYSDFGVLRMTLIGLNTASMYLVTYVPTADGNASNLRLELRA